jgi:hypothetical protein
MMDGQEFIAIPLYVRKNVLEEFVLERTNVFVMKIIQESFVINVKNILWIIILN